MTPLRPSSLLDRRLVIVTGKGGTGKTTVAAALAVAAAGAGLRVLLVEVGRDEQIPSLFAPGSPPGGYAGREVHPGITAMQIDPFAALGEYLALQLGVSAPVALVLRNRGFRQLMEASPGWRELITLGKVWHLEQMQVSPRARALGPDRGRCACDRPWCHLPLGAAGGGLRPARRSAAPARGEGRSPGRRSACGLRCSRSRWPRSCPYARPSSWFATSRARWESASTAWS